MPKLTYTPEGADPRVFEFTWGRLMSPERIALERATGMAWGQIQQAFYARSTVVLDAFLHILMKRQVPDLRLPTQAAAGAIEWCDDELEVDLTDAEAVEFVEANRDSEDPELREAAAVIAAEPHIAELLAAAPSDPKDEG